MKKMEKSFYYTKRDVSLRHSFGIKPKARPKLLPTNSIVKEFSDSFIDDEGKEVKSLYKLAVINGEVYLEAGWTGFRLLTSHQVKAYKKVNEFALAYGVKPVLIS